MFIAYSIVNHLNVISIILIRNESSEFSAIMKILFGGLVLGHAVLFYFGPPWAFHIIKLLKVQILGTC